MVRLWSRALLICAFLVSGSGCFFVVELIGSVPGSTRLSDAGNRIKQSGQADQALFHGDTLNWSFGSLDGSATCVVESLSSSAGTATVSPGTPCSSLPHLAQGANGGMELTTLPWDGKGSLSWMPPVSVVGTYKFTVTSKGQTQSNYVSVREPAFETALFGRWDARFATSAPGLPETGVVPTMGADGVSTSWIDLARGNDIDFTTMPSWGPTINWGPNVFFWGPNLDTITLQGFSGGATSRKVAVSTWVDTQGTLMSATEVLWSTTGTLGPNGIRLAGDLRDIAGSLLLTLDGVASDQTMDQANTAIGGVWARWKLDEASAAGAANDSVGTRHGAYTNASTAIGMVLDNPANPDMALANAAKGFGGNAGSYMRVSPGNLGAFSMAGPWTVMMTFNAGAFGGELFRYANGAGEGFRGLVWNNPTYPTLVVNWKSPTFTSDGTWHMTDPLELNRVTHVAVVLDGGATTKIKVYINGAITETYFTDGSATNFGVGDGYFYVGQGFNGSIDDVTVFSTALSHAQVLSAKNAAQGCRTKSAVLTASGIKHNVVGTYDGANAEIHVDGRVECSVPMAGKLASHSGAFRFNTEFNGIDMPILDVGEIRAYSADAADSFPEAVDWSSDFLKSLSKYSPRELGLDFFKKSLIAYLDPALPIMQATVPAGLHPTTRWLNLAGGEPFSLTGYSTLSGSEGFRGAGTPADPYRFVTSSSYGERLNSRQLTAVSGDLTGEFWVRTTQTSANYIQLFQSYEANVHFSFQGGVSGQLAFLSPGGSVTGGVTPNDGQWHHLVYSLDGGTGVGKVYVDGALSFQGPYTASTITPGGLNGNVVFNDQSGQDRNYEGDLGLFRLYDTALQGTEVLRNCNVTKFRFQGATCAAP